MIGLTTSLGGTSPVVLREDVVKSETECIAEVQRSAATASVRPLYEKKGTRRRNVQCGRRISTSVVGM